MKVLLLSINLLLMSSYCFSQDFQGKAEYMSKTKFEFDFGSRKVPEEHKERMQKRMDDAMQKTFVLNFNKVASIYEEKVKLDTEEKGGRGGRGAMFASIIGGPSVGKSYKNVVDKESKRAVEFFGKNFLVEDPLKPFQWKLEKEMKKIGRYNCFKASVSVDRELNPFAKNNDTISTKTIIEVWYTPEIPVSLGPDKYWGLPGLILSVNAGDTQIICTKVVLNVKDKYEIKAPKKGKKVSEEEFDEIVAKKTVELKERFKNGRPGGGKGPKR